MNKTYPKLTLVSAFAFLLFISLACNNAEPPAANSASQTNAAAPSNTTAAPVSSSKDISGDYTIAGTNEGGGGAYQGALKVTKRDEVYQFSWASGDRTYDGVGVQTNNAVGVAFSEGADGKGCGVVLYAIGADGTLNGKAGYWGVNESETETAKHTSGTGLEGSYDITGTNIEGKDYKGTLAVKKSGAGYDFAWNAGQPLKGFGILGDKMVAVGIGGSKCGFVGYDVMPDGTLAGKWGSPGSTSVGTEVAKKK